MKVIVICATEVNVGVKLGSSDRVHLSGNVEERSHVHEFKSSSSWKYDDTMNKYGNHEEMLVLRDERVEL